MVQIKCVFKTEYVPLMLTSHHNTDSLHIIVCDDSKKFVEIGLYINDRLFFYSIRGTVYQLHNIKENIFESEEFEHSCTSTSIEIAILYKYHEYPNLYFINDYEDDDIDVYEYLDPSYNHYGDQLLNFPLNNDNDKEYNIDSRFCKGKFSIEIYDNELTKSANKVQ